MITLLLRLAGPLQAWGAKSRFTVRTTELAPTKSGVIGLLAAAVGRRRTDPIEDLFALRFGVRKDQPGTVVRDFHTARTLDGRNSMPLSERYYLADAVFLAGIEGDRALLEGIDEAIHNPAFPLYLGRRSCPPGQPMSLGLREKPLVDALHDEPWLASDWFRRRQHEGTFQMELLVDQDAIPPKDRTGDVHGYRDAPLSYDPRRRDYGFRDVERMMVPIGEHPVDDLDPMSTLEEADACS